MESTGSSPEPDLTVKYQKLATEYSKLRTNTSVLKKAVADEQSKSVELREQLKEKDQVVRKLEQEIECLDFRNVQLSKRVKILQDDLQASKDKPKKNKNKVPVALPMETQNILGAELSSRIEENEKLHQQVYSAEMEHKKSVDELTERLEMLQKDTTRQQEVLNETIAKQDSVVKKLTEERAKMEVKIKSLEKELGEIREQEHSGMEEMKKAEDDLQSKLQTSSNILYEKLPFVDCRHNYLKKYNVQVTVRKHWNRATGLLDDLASILSDFVRKLSDLHMYTEQQVRLNEDSSVTNCKLLEHLGEHVSHLKSIENAYESLASQIFHDGVWTEGFRCSDFVDAVHRYVQYLKKLLPYIHLFLESKVTINANIVRVADAFRKLQTVSFQLVNAFCIFSKWLSILANHSHLKQTHGLCLSLETVFRNVLHSAQRLLDCLNDARIHTSAKIAVESQLPTVTVEMKTTDECILSCFVSLFNLLEKMLSLAKENAAIFENGSVGPMAHGPTHQSTILMRDRGLKYILQLNEDDSPQGIPHLLALEHQKSIGNFYEVREAAQQKLGLLESKLSKIEQEKEHWLLEFQLLQAKQKREMGNTDATENQGTVSTQDMEACVKAHIHKLLGRLQVADSKSVAFESEFRATFQNLHILESEHGATKSELDETRMHLDSLKETHQATVNNYEDQLATMSEHLANMNEKLSSQKDEIDNLKQLANKKSKGK